MGAALGELIEGKAGGVARVHTGASPHRCGAMSDPGPIEPILQPASEHGWRGWAFRIIFRHGQRDERLFDLALIVAILVSVLVVILDSVEQIHAVAGDAFYLVEWVFTLVFTVEYVVRLSVLKRPWRYATSFYGIVDLLAIVPTYLGLFFAGAAHLIVIRVLRILRIFRILKLSEYVGEASTLLAALARSRRKITLFVCVVLALTTIFGSIMYLVEGPEHGFTSIPRGIYWAIVTMATVGFGDITPKTTLGQVITSVIIIVGYGIIAVPTGIYTAELIRGRRDARGSACPRCGVATHRDDARYCHGCGERLDGASRQAPCEQRNPGD